MPKIKTSELTGAALDWAVAKCEGLDIDSLEAGNVWVWETDPLTGERERVVLFRPTRNWAQGGPIIERERISIRAWTNVPVFHAYMPEEGADWSSDGTSPLVAAMRCYCCSKLGDEVDVPDELLP